MEQSMPTNPETRYCNECGSQIPNDANFCHKCGKPISGKHIEESKWETCQIVFARKGIFLQKIKFWVDAIGPKGQYNAGETEFVLGEYPMGGWKGHSRIHTELISKLVADGWEPTGDRGDQWYAIRFRRRYKTKSA